jgi:[protein-PII] uridylyltransferase
MTSLVNQKKQTDLSLRHYANLLKTGRRAELISHLKADISQHRSYLRTLRKEDARRLVYAQSNYIDKIISIFYHLAKSLSGAETEENEINIAVVSVGGYGRRELCPYSDIDLLFLYRDKIDKYVEILVNEILYFLWDLGFQVGHSCRSTKESLQLARSDLTVCTSLIESRYIAGNKTIHDLFFNALLAQVRKQGDGFVLEKIREQTERHAQYDYAVNLLEPNIKESPGGLRDYNLCLWAATVQYGLNTYDNLPDIKILSNNELKIFMGAVEFLLKVRNQLHFSCSRRSDILAMDYQDPVARELGYKKRGRKSASQQLMQDYYIHANRIRYLSQIFLQHCLKKGNKKKRPSTGKIDIEEGFCALDGELVLLDEKKNPFKAKPLLMMVVFQWCGRYNLVMSNDLKRLIQKNKKLIDEDFQTSGEIRDIFLSILKFRNSAQILRQMHEINFLGRYIPEFEPLTCLAQRDLYHQFTVDEHTLKAIHYLEELPSDPNLSELADLYNNDLKKPEIVKLALLFHDLGKGKEAGHITGSIEETNRFLNRMQFDSDTQKNIVFLVGKHLEMNYLAQHHDLDDTHTIRSFADQVGSVENLKMLYLISYADIRSVGHDVWNDWKEHLLSDLYNRTARFLEKKITGNLKQKVLDSLPPEIDPKDAEIYFDSLPDRHQEFFSPEKTIRHLKLMTEKKKNSIQISYDQYVNFTELMVCTDNCRGVLAQITGVLASQNINILGAHVNTLKNGIAIDTLQITDIDYKPIIDPNIVKRLKKKLVLVLEGKQDLDSLKPSRKRFLVLKKEAALPVPTQISLDNAFSPHYSVIQLTCRDRLGLLYDITRSLSGMGIDISMAKITTEAHRAIDTFYATEKDNKKITDSRRQEAIKKKLNDIID